jgi:carboxyl-terminal processing protease
MRAEATPEAQNPYQSVAQLGRVLVQIENNYVDPVERGKMVEGAIKGMVENLDPHSSYLPPDEWKQFQSDTEGKFGGVGLEVDGRGE